MRPWAPLVVPPRITPEVIERMLELLVALDCDYLREHPRTPLLYRSGVRYVKEPPGEEKWLTVPWCLQQLAKPSQPVDCEDLACWRAAELRVRFGEQATPFWTARVLPRGRMYHIQVRREDGSIEDPSAVLGMGGGFASRWGATSRIVP